jgi:hypothetical protein
MVLAVVAGALSSIPGCGSGEPTGPRSAGVTGGAGGTTATGGVGGMGADGSSVGGSTLGATSSSLPPCTPAATGARPHEAGNYDNRSCNATDCHNGDVVGGGWVYASAKGPPWVVGATVIITNTDGTTATAVSAEDGFFNIVGTVSSPYHVCVSKCPGVDCNLTTHSSVDCQTSNCHGIASQRIYVSQNTGGSPGTGGAGSVGGGACVPAASGGPYTHTEYVYGNQPCSGSGCHTAPKPVFKGGFLYEGPTSSTTVVEATITLTPAGGVPVTAVTGPDGMFFFGTVGATSTAKEFTAPYTACVSKCPLSLCSIANGHTTTDDCQTANCHSPERKVYLSP